MRGFVIIPVVVAILVTALSSVFIVDERKKALVLQFGGAAGTLAALDIGAINHALHRHHGRTMHLLGSTRCRLCRGGHRGGVDAKCGQSGQAAGACPIG